MSNLPIASSNPQSPAQGITGNSPQPRNDSAAAAGNAGPASQTNSTNDQATESFSVLLARQIGENVETKPDSAKFFASVDGKTTAVHTDAADKNGQGPSSVLAGNPTDPNLLAAMLLHIPVQQSDAPAKDTQPGAQLRGDAYADTGQQGSSSILARWADGIKQKNEDSLQQASGKPVAADGTTAVKDNMRPTDPVPQPASPVALISETVKHMSIGDGSAAQQQANQSNAKTSISGGASGVMQNLQTGDIHSDTPQTVASPLGNSAWANEFSQKIVWMASQQNQSAELHLNPPDLGPLNVVLKITDNQLTAMFTSPHNAVRDAVENALPKLREILADNNIMLGNATVSDQPPRDRSGDGFMNQGSGATPQRDTFHHAIESPPITAPSSPVRRHNGILDTFA